MTTHSAAKLRRPWRCRRGKHHWEYEGNLIYHTYRCKDCNDYRDPDGARLVALARQILDEERELSPKLTIVVGRAAIRFADARQTPQAP